MATKNVRSIEEQVEDWCKAQLRSIKYYTKTESINSEIEEALRKAPIPVKVEVKEQTIRI